MALMELRAEVPEIPPEEVGFPLPYLSPITGTFAEIRNHNLHLGSDFKSYGLNGHDILATLMVMWMKSVTQKQVMVYH